MVNYLVKLVGVFVLLGLLNLAGCSTDNKEEKQTEFTPYQKPEGYLTVCSGRYQFDIPEPYDLKQLVNQYFMLNRKIDISAEKGDTYISSPDSVKDSLDAGFEKRINEMKQEIDIYNRLIERAKAATDDGTLDSIIKYQGVIEEFQEKIEIERSRRARFKMLPFKHPKSFMYFDGYHQVHARLLRNDYYLFFNFSRLNDAETDEQLISRAMDFLNKRLVLVEGDNYPKARGLCLPGAYVLDEDSYLEQKLEFALQSAPDVLYTVLISDGYKQSVGLREDRLALFIANNHHQDEFTKVAIGSRRTKWTGVVHLPDDEELTRYLVAEGKIEPPEEKDTTSEDIGAAILGMGAYADLVVAEKKKLIKELNVDVTQIPGLRYEGGSEVNINYNNQRQEPHVVFFMKSPSKRYHPKDDEERQTAPPFAQSKQVLINMMRSFRLRENGHALQLERSSEQTEK
jgi:hypothetical protein